MDMSKPPKDKMTIITHTFDAPRDLVFKAWSKPEYIARWFGPHTFTVPECRWDLTVGAEYYIVMQAPDGVHYPSWGVFEEVVAPEKIVFRSWAFKNEDGEPNLVVHNTVTFEDQGQKTFLTLRAVILEQGPGMDDHLGGMSEGWTESFEKLANVLLLES